MLKFPQILKDLRIERGLLRQELADQIFVSARTICYWKLGQRECSLEQLIQLAFFFGISTDYLLGLEL